MKIKAAVLYAMDAKPPFEERTVKGSYIGTCVPSRDIPRYIDLYRQGKLAVNRLMSGTLKLEDINRGFDLLNERKAVRQVVVFH
jgi:alcohol dehydrogenase